MDTRRIHQKQITYQFSYNSAYEGIYESSYGTNFVFIDEDEIEESDFDFDSIFPSDVPTGIC
jgi:hypothetical protein